MAQPGDSRSGGEVVGGAAQHQDVSTVRPPQAVAHAARQGARGQSELVELGSGYDAGLTIGQSQRRGSG